MGKKVSLIRFIMLLVKKSRQDRIMEYAYHLTYNLLLSFFPFLIFLITLVGYANLDSSLILSSLEKYLPTEVYKLVSEIVNEVVSRERNGLMSFSILFSIYAASGGFRAFMEASNRAMGIDEERNIIIVFLLSVFWVVLFAIAILIALLGIVFGRHMLYLINLYFSPVNEFLELFRIFIPVLIIFLLFLAFYMFVPSHKVCFRCAIPGTIFTTGTWIIFTLLFQFYVNNYANYSRFYGALGAVVALLLWLLLTSIIMLVGVELNALLMDLNMIKPVGRQKKS